MFGLLALTLSCNRENRGKESGNTVYGRVTVKNEPFRMGTVKFYSPPGEDGMPRMMGMAPINPETGTYEAQNLPPGEFIVVVDVDMNRPPGSVDINDMAAGGPPIPMGPPMGPPKGPPGGPPFGGPPMGFPKGPMKGPPGDKGKDPNEAFLASMPVLREYSLEKSKLVVTVTSGSQEFNIDLK